MEALFYFYKNVSCPFEENSLGRNIFKGSRGRSICFGLMTLISEIGWISLTQTVVSPTLPTIVTPPLPPFGERAFPQSRAPLYHGSVLPPLFSPCPILPFFFPSPISVTLVFLFAEGAAKSAGPMRGVARSTPKWRI